MRKLLFSISILVVLAALVLARDALWNRTKLGHIRNKMESEYVMVEMRDGVRLRTRVWKPAEGGKHPVVLERGYRTGYEKHAEAFTQASYVYVGQQTRGSLRDNMFFPDAKDGYDCLEWISKQS